MRSRRISLLEIYLLMVATCVGLFAQANQGSITGTVKDQTGAVVPNASIEIRNTNTNALFSSGATDTGNFVVPLPVGTYDLSVAMPGFKKFVQTGISVVEGAATRRDIQLEVGQVSETLTVTDTAPLLKTEAGDVSYRVTSQLSNQLPVLQISGTGFGTMGNIRNPLQMATILPGVSLGLGGGFYQQMVVNGLPSNSQTWTIEGQDATPSLWRGVTSDRGQGGVDAIEAMSVQTSNFAAEFGKAGGAAINFTMKSGTNKFHGSVYDYFANEFLNAGTPFTDYAFQNNPATAYKSGQHVRNPVRRQDYGVTIGGPIKIPKIYNGQDKSFFFFNFEQFRQTNTTANGVASVPTAAYRNGDFTNSGCTVFNATTQTCTTRPTLTQNGVAAVDSAGNPVVYGGIYNPSSYTIVNGFPVRTQYPGNQVPLTSFDKVAVNIQNQFPLATNGNLVNNYNIPTYSTYRHTTIPSIKIDHNLSSTMRVSGYWGQTVTNTPNYNGFAAEDFPWTSQQSNPTRNHTLRVNFDYTMTPTLILHIGAGYFWQKEPNVANPYDQSLIGLPAAGATNAFFAPDVYPTIGGTSSGTYGGFSPGIGASFDATAWEQKPTGNINLTWVKNNHTFKFGGDMTLEGYPTHNKWRANGNFTFSANQTGNPWEFGQPGLNFPTNPTGFGYASFLMGSPNNMALAQQTSTRLGGHAFAFFAQDNWKVTPKLTVEYGLRYDFQTYLSEQYGRYASASFSTFNPTVGRLGGQAYEGGGPCSCKLSSNYPYAFGPRANISYQITPKTVFRAGFGVNYNVVQTPAGSNFSVGDFYVINNPGYGITPLTSGLQGGNLFYPGNPYGNTQVIWPTFDPGRIPTSQAGLLPPGTPYNTYHPDSRPGRIAQWSVGLQREIVRNLVIEATYVGNRGAWFYASQLDTQGGNSLGNGQLARYGLDISNQADRTLLQQLVGSPQAIARGIALPYAGFPTTQTVSQAIRPVPQWGTLTPYLGPTRGNTYYDALQFQATKRYSNNLDLTANVTYAHAMVLGVSGDTDYYLGGRAVVTDPWNRGINKQLNQLTPPLKTVISGTYTTPRINGAGWVKYASVALKDWQIGAVLQYQSGSLLQVPTSNNALVNQMQINTPGGAGNSTPGTNTFNRVPGVGLFRDGFDPNADVDFRTYNPANPADAKVASYLAGSVNANGTCTLQVNCAWANPADGQWGTTSPFLEGFRWRRRPSEAFNFGRNFRFGKENRFLLNVRAEFQNIFNRTFYNAPSTTTPTSVVTTQTQGGVPVLNGGYGVVNTFNGAGSSPRSGTLVGRLTF